MLMFYCKKVKTIQLQKYFTDYIKIFIVPIVYFQYKNSQNHMPKNTFLKSEHLISGIN